MLCLWGGGRYAFSSSDLIVALNDGAVSRIVLAAGTYEFTSDMCTGSVSYGYVDSNGYDGMGSALCINRALTIEAEVPGAVVLNAMGGRRVFEIQSSGAVELIGLNITGGKADLVQSACVLNLP